MDQPPRNHPDLGDTSEVDPLVAALTTAGDDLASTPVPDEVAERQLAAIASLAAEHAHTVPAVPAVGTRPRRVRRVLGLTAVKLGLAAGVAAATTGGLAATGSLPDPVQRVVSDGAGHIGINLPSPDDPVLPDEADDEASDRVDLPTLPTPADPLDEGQLPPAPVAPDEDASPEPTERDGPPGPTEEASDQASEPAPRPHDSPPDGAGADEPPADDREGAEEPDDPGADEALSGDRDPGATSGPDRSTVSALNSSRSVPKEPAESEH